MTGADAVFVALADPSRRAVLALLGERPASASALARELPISRQAVLKHLAVLDESALVTAERSGREVIYRVRPAALLSTADWLRSVAAEWDGRLRELKRLAELADRARATRPSAE